MSRGPAAKKIKEMKVGKKLPFCRYPSGEANRPGIQDNANQGNADHIWVY